MPPVPTRAAPESAPARTPDAPAPEPRPEAEAGPSFDLRLGDLIQAIPLVGDVVTVTAEAYTVDLTAVGLSLPGVHFTRLRLARGADGLPTGGTLSGDIAAPFVRGSAELTVDSAGDVSGSATADLEVEVLGRPQISFSYVDRRFRGAVTVEGHDLRLPIPNVTVDEGRATVSFDGESLTGTLTARFHHAALGEGDVTVTLSDEGAEGSGGFRLTMPLLEGSAGTFTVDREGRLGADATLTANGVNPPIPGLTLSSLTGTVGLHDGHVAGTVGLVAAYAGLATVTINEIAISDTGFGGANGTIAVTAPPLQGSSGTLVLDAEGRPSGEVTIAAEQIPIPALQRGQVTIGLRPDGGVDVSGSGRIEIGAVGGGDFTVGWEEGVLSLGADVQLTVPGLQPVTGRVDWRDGDLSGQVQTGVTVGPLSGTVLLRYAEEQFSGEGRLDYAVGRFSGWVLLRVDPQAVVSGEGEATVQFADWLRGTIGLTVLPDLNVDARGEIVFPSAVQLFPAWRFERSFFNFQQSFPLWGITIPVVGSIGLIAEIRASAGFRAAFGPGEFRNIRAAGEISTRPNVEPSFQISGDLFIPAGAEIVLSVSGGVGLAALIAQITGGINLEGIAGVYGSITLTPTFAYREGDYSLRGDALLQAAAQLKARINAYASVVAGFGWLSTEVWRRDWNLAEWGFDTGWSIGLHAGIEWIIGQPFQPNLEFDEVDVDPESIIHAAIPNSGDPVPAPPHPTPPVAAFQPTDGQATATGSPAGGPAPSQPPVPAAPAAAPAVPGVPGAAAVPGQAAPPAEGATPPRVDPPDAETEQPEERTVEEQYLVYVYETLGDVLRRKKDSTAPSDKELAKREDTRREEKRTEQKVKGPDEPERRRLAADPDVDPVPAPDDEKDSNAKPLSPAVRSRMEQIFDTDLTHVKVHTDEAARTSAKRLGAEAYTVGEDVYFGGSRNPDAGDDALLAHELVHVVQGPSGEGVSKPGDPLEQEAEEAAKAVKRGEKPLPIKKKDDGSAVHRVAAAATGSAAAGDEEGQRVDAAAHIRFDYAGWQAILNNSALRGPPNSLINQKIAQLQSLPQVTAKSKQEVFDATSKSWKERTFVPMHFPGPTFLPHRSVTDSTQIVAGEYLRRAGGVREDSAQNQLSRLMYDSPPEAADAGPDREFTRTERGTYDPVVAWDAYLRAGTTQTHHTPDPNLVTGQKTSESAWSLNLSKTGFDAMWNSGYVFSGSRWRLPGGADPAAAPPAGGTDAATRAIMIADYESHHVIPLWLRSASGHPDGDQLANLAPWHKSAHQTNHAWHHATPKKVRDATHVDDYREFNPETPFLLFETAGGNQPHPAGAPAVQLDTSGTRPKWASSNTGHPIWAPNI